MAQMALVNRYLRLSLRLRIVRFGRSSARAMMAAYALQFSRISTAKADSAAPAARSHRPAQRAEKQSHRVLDEGPF
jgi:hypothetical protein